MQNLKPFRPKNLNEIVYLEKYNKTFWEIKFEKNQMKTIIRCGKLQENGEEDNERLVLLEKSHHLLRTVVDYIADRVNIKLQKGYKIREGLKKHKESSKGYFESIPIQENLGKRRNSDMSYSNIQGAQPIKKNHFTENSKNNPTLNYSQNLTKIEVQESLRSLNFNTKEEVKNTFCFKSIQNKPKTMSSDNYSYLKEASQRSQSQKSEREAEKEHHFEYSNQVNGEIKEEHIAQNKPFFNINMKKGLNQDNFEIDKQNASMTKLSNTELKNFHTSNLSNDSCSNLLGLARQKSLENYDKSELKEEFQKKLSSLSVTECPFGKPIFEMYQNLAIPSKWEKEDPTGWYLSEKLDGIRCIWNGFEMHSTDGVLYDIPDYFLENLPKSPLDGVLYGEKGHLSQCKAIVEKKSTDPEWNNLNFVIYDAPELKEPFQDRLRKLNHYFWNRPYVKVHDYIICEGMVHAKQEFRKIEDSHGEGMILTYPQYIYKKGKSNLLLEKLVTQSLTEILDKF